VVGRAANARLGDRALEHFGFEVIFTWPRIRPRAHNLFFPIQSRMVLVRFISIIHFLLIMFLVLAPFIADEKWLDIHFMIIPFILAHWATNQSVCALTEMEKLLTGKTQDEETFIGKIVSPVYKFKTKGEEMLFTWLGLISLWLITLFKLQKTGFSGLKADFGRVLDLLTRLRTPPR
jgi:hypothetical protein